MFPLCNITIEFYRQDICLSQLRDHCTCAENYATLNGNVGLNIC